MEPLTTIEMKYFKHFKNEDVISASSSWKVPIPEGDINTHNFFNELSLDNLSGRKIAVRFNMNQDQYKAIPPSSGRDWTFTEDNLKYSTLEIFNLDTVNDISAGEIDLIVIKKRKSYVGEK